MKIFLLLISIILCVNIKAQCPQVTITSQYGIICNSQKNQFIATGAATYSWSPVFSIISSSPNGDTVIVQPSISTVYTLTATSGTCTTQSTITLTVNNCTPPKTGFTRNADTICINHCILFTDTTQLHSTKPLFYSWVFPGGNIAPILGGTIHADTLYYNLTTSTPLPVVKVCYPTNSLLYGSSGFYPVTQTATNGINQTYTYRDSVIVYPAPHVSFNIVQSPAPHTWNINANYQSQAGGVSAIWYWGDGTSTAGLYPSHIYAAPGRYNISVSMTDITGCKDSLTHSDSVYRYSSSSNIASSIVFVNVKNPTTGIANNTQNADIQIYPNPAQNSCTIQTNSTNNQTLNLFDVNGQLVLTQTINQTTIVDVSGLAQGIYNLNLISPTAVLNKRLLIIK